MIDPVDITAPPRPLPNWTCSKSPQACAKSLGSRGFRRSLLAGVGGLPALVVACVMACTWVPPLRAQCVAQNMAVLNPGAYGALSPQAYERMKDALLTADRGKLSALMAQNLVVSLPPGKSVCIIQVDFERHGKLIHVPGLEASYWVLDEAFSSAP